MTAEAAEPPSAGDKETARALHMEATDKLAAGDLGGALRAYKAADAIMGVPTTGVSVGEVLEKMGRLIEARDTLLRVARHPTEPDEPPPFTEARARAARLAEALAARIPSVTIVVRGPSIAHAEVSIDGVRAEKATLGLPRRLDPGAHAVAATAPGYASADERFELTEGESRRIDLVLRETPSGKVSVSDVPPPSGPTTNGSVSPLVFIGFGVGAAALVVGTVLGALVLSRANELEAVCPDKRCAPEDKSRLDTTVALSHASTACFVVAGVGVGLGTIGLFVASGDDSTAHTRARAVTPAGLAWSGRF